MATRGSVGVLGFGSFGRALAERLAEVGYEVQCASRSPESRTWSVSKPCPVNIVITTWSEAIARSDLLFVAIQSRDQARVLHEFRFELSGKILVDVSNPDSRDERSHAEKLAAGFPECHIIKAFNALSAVDINKKNISSKVGNVCGDDLHSKIKVLGIARDMGITVVDYGPLENAREMEVQPRELYRGWGLPTIITTIFMILWLLYSIFRYYYNRSNPYTWSRFPMNVTQKIFACTSLWLLALCYIPGSLACFAHIIYGTKYRRFPAWLDRWLKMRKQLGLMAFYLAVLHAVIVFLIMNPAYFSKWYERDAITVPFNATSDTKVALASRMSWYGETVTFLGILAVVFMSVLAVTSLPSVADALTWSEWRFVQSYFGLFVLLLSTAHVAVKGFPGWLEDPFSSNVQGLAFLSSVPAWIALILRFITFMPCVYYYVEKIRSGWSRGVAEKDPEQAINVYKQPIKNHEMKAISNGGTVNHSFHGDEVKTSL